jgi:hypothetical protein
LPRPSYFLYLLAFEHLLISLPFIFCNLSFPFHPPILDPTQFKVISFSFMAAHSSPEVIIAGGGLGGLFLGALFEKSGTPYIILERSTTVKAMGIVRVLFSNICRVKRNSTLYIKHYRFSLGI